ncbi:MAG: hypothetical protein HYZ49_09885 [Chloroflexi bacterium]|nr:hypothetical protein [Chloroflexota bacterium]
MNVNSTGIAPRLPIRVCQSLFGISLIVLLAYLIAVRAGLYLPVSLFWGGSALAITALVVWILISHDEAPSLIWALWAIMTLVWLFKTIFAPATVPFFGSDAYHDYAATSEIGRSGWLALSPWNEGLSLWPHQTSYPFLSAISLSLTGPVQLSLMTWARWSMPFLSLISLQLVYAISLEVYQSKRVALLGALGFGLTYMYLMFHSLYVRETLAFALFLAAIYSIVKSQETAGRFYRLAAMALSVGVIFAHHLMALALLMFVLLALVAHYGARLSWLKDRLHFSSVGQINFTLWLFIFVALSMYWLYLRYTPLRLAESLFQDATAGPEVAALKLPQTARYTILLYLQMLTTALFGLLALAGSFTSGKSRRVWHTIFVLWGGMMGLGSVLVTLGRVQGTSSLPSRFEILSYAFLLPAAAYTVLISFQGRRWLSWPLGLVFVVYGLNSLYRVPAHLYSQRQPDLAQGETRSLLLRQEYDLILQLRPEADIFAGLGLYRLIRPLTGNNPGCAHCDLEPAIPSPSASLIVGERDQYQFASNISLESFTAGKLGRIYDAGWAEVYAPPLSVSRGFQMRDLLSASDSLPVFNAGDQVLPWLLATGQIVLLILCGAGLTVLARADVEAGLGLGVALALLLVFVEYLLANLLGAPSPGWLAPLTLAGLAGLSLWRLWRQSASNKIMLIILLTSVLMLGYGPLADRLSRQAAAEPYTEFYVESVASCDSNICIGLRLINHEGQTTTYRVHRVTTPIILNDSESWQGTLTLPAAWTDPLRVDLQKDSGPGPEQSLVLRFAP